MFVEVNGARLFFDVEGAKLVPDGATMRERPTVVFVHGGPGFDHSAFRTLAQWGDDVRGLCDALAIEKPIVLGLSFGGFVAQSYATRHPDHPAKLILISTVPRVVFETVYDLFGELGGPEAREVAKTYWDDPTPERRAAFIARCVPLYRQHGTDGEAVRRVVMKTATAIHFNGPRNEHGRMDFRADLAKIRCPVLLLPGDRHPITPIAFADELAAALPPHPVRYERFPGCGHGVHAEDPDRARALIRDFVAAP